VAVIRMPETERYGLWHFWNIFQKVEKEK